MNKPDASPEMERPSTGAPEDAREKPRFALLLRSAKLVGERGEHLCIVRDVSETGVRLRLFAPLDGEKDLRLEIQTGQQIPVFCVWERDGEAGFRFGEPIDLVQFISEEGPYPKRSVRVKLDHPAMLHYGGVSMPARICNLSREGAGIETEAKLAIRQNLRIESDFLPTFEAIVCWRRHPEYGLALNQVMSLSELAERTHALQIADRAHPRQAS